jgi:hypothetical protein
MHNPFYTMGTFPYDNAIIARIEEKTQKVLAWELAYILDTIH